MSLYITFTVFFKTNNKSFNFKYLMVKYLKFNIKIYFDLHVWIALEWNSCVMVGCWFSVYSYIRYIIKDQSLLIILWYWFLWRNWAPLYFDVVTYLILFKINNETDLSIIFFISLKFDNFPSNAQSAKALASYLQVLMLNIVLV